MKQQPQSIAVVPARLITITVNSQNGNVRDIDANLVVRKPVIVGPAAIIAIRQNQRILRMLRLQRFALALATKLTPGLENWREEPTTYPAAHKSVVNVAIPNTSRFAISNRFRVFQTTYDVYRKLPG
jgi:hypothetical protein